MTECLQSSSALFDGIDEVRDAGRKDCGITKMVVVVFKEKYCVTNLLLGQNQWNKQYVLTMLYRIYSGPQKSKTNSFFFLFVKFVICI